MAPYYAYDAENKMKTAGGEYDNGGTSYTYDGDGRCVKKASYNGEVTVFVYDALGRAVAEYSNQVQAHGVSYLTQDTLGSTRAVTDKDGAIRSRHDYFPFGEEILAGTGGRTTEQGYSQFDRVRQSYTGAERDTETGLDFMQARYFSSTQGRFASPDPLLSSGELHNPQTWNRYAYVLNNPLLYTDPLGLYVFDRGMSQAQRDKFDAAFQQAKGDLTKIAEKYGMNSTKYINAKRALDAYGDKGVNNGVTIFAKDGRGAALTQVAGTAIAKTKENPNGQNIRVSFDEASFDNSQLGEMIAHEGSHVADGSDWVKSGFANSKNPTVYQFEFDAYMVQSSFAEARVPDGASYQTLPFARVGKGKNPYLFEMIEIWNSGWVEVDKETLRRTNINAVLARPRGKAGGLYGVTPTNPGGKQFTKGSKF